MSSLADLACEPVPAKTKPLKGDALTQLSSELGGNWKVVDEHHLEKSFTFPNFVTALAFVNKLGELAEREQHHPDILLCWGKVTLTLWTHSIGGLSRSDFIMAAKCDRVH